jgi:hypothetical protein
MGDGAASSSSLTSSPVHMPIPGIQDTCIGAHLSVEFSISSQPLLAKLEVTISDSNDFFHSYYCI